MIISVNSMGEEYQDAHFCETEIASLPYRCGGIVCMVIEPYYHRGSVSSTGERCSPLQICCRGVRVSAVFLFNFQASNKVQEVLFCAIRTSHRVHLTHVDKMFPHTLSLRKVSDLW